MSKAYNEIDCMVCGKTLDNLQYEMKTGKQVEVHPMGGLHFSSFGHYGSTIFDPIGTGESLDIAICDLCIMKNMDKVRGTGKQELEDTVDGLVDVMERHG
jgi:hypothetical protein